MIESNDPSKAAPAYSYTPGEESAVDGVANLGRDEGIPDAEEVFRRALREPFGFSLVVKMHQGRTATVVAFQIGFLLRDKASERLQIGREPFGQLLREKDGSLFPNEDEVGKKNADGGSDALLADFIVSKRLSSEERGRVRAQMASTFVDLYAGNRIRCILFQVRDRKAAERARPSGYETIVTYEDAEGDAPERPILLRYTDHSPTHHNLLATRFLQYRPPVLRLPPGGREIVRFAAMGQTDAQIVRRYGIRSASLNSRWTRVLDIAEAKMPELFEGVAYGRNRDRLPLLTYVRNHPEELWPYEEPTGDEEAGRRGS